MKTLLFILLFFGIELSAQIDTICLQHTVAARIADSLQLLNHYKDYALTCDSLLVLEQSRASSYDNKITILEKKALKQEKMLSLCDEQLGEERELSLLWQNYAAKQDAQVKILQEKIQKKNKIITTICIVGGSVIAISLVGFGVSLGI